MTTVPEHSWIDILSALLTPTIALAGALIAYLQWKTNDQKRKNDLFDRRYKFHTRLEGMWLATGNDEEKSECGLDVEDLVPIATEAKFLFGEDICDHILSLKGKAHTGSDFFPNDDFVKPFERYLQLR